MSIKNGDLWFVSNFHFPLYTSSFHITIAFSTFQPRKQTPWHLQAGCRPIMCSYSVRSIYRPGGQPTMHSVLIIRHLQGGPWPADRPCVLQFSNFQSRNGPCGIYRLGHRWLTDHAHCKCLIIRTLRMVGQPPSL